MLNKMHHGKTMLPIIVLLGNTNVSVLRTPAFKTKHMQVTTNADLRGTARKSKQRHDKNTLKPTHT